jgi:hypothetical protein
MSGIGLTSPASIPPRFRILGALIGILACAAIRPIPAESAITVGPGPAIGTDRAGATWYQDFQDWTHSDLRALDDAGLGDAVYSFGDGYDDSRDVIAFYYRAEGDYLYFRADLYDLALGAEQSNLNLYVAIDWRVGGQAWLPDFLDVQTDTPWEACLAIYQSGTTLGSSYNLWDENFNVLSGGYAGSYFNSQLDAVEFGIQRAKLAALGWDGTSVLRFQVFTTKDNTETSCSGGGRSSDITDSIVDDDRGCSDGVLNGTISSSDGAGLVTYASIAHGNQSVNRAGDIGAHIYDPQSNTGISGGTGFLRTLDTHEIFKVPLNIHPSGTLTIACNWATRPTGAADPQDGPAFLARIREFVDADQSTSPGSLIGGVLAEHIMPYFEGDVNAASIAATDSLNREVYGRTAAEVEVMHTPERVIRSQSTGYAPLDGQTFEDIAASPYVATYLDEITHLHGWFYPGESCQPDQGYRHKVHKINGVYCFMINDREDQGKFGNFDGGMVMDTRYSLLQKSLYGSSSEIVVVFDDWEALAGKSFDPNAGTPIPNNNPNQYHNTIRWAANHPWIRISNLKDVLATALANPSAFVIDHGFRYDLGIQTYEWLKHASENSYNYWYYNQNAGYSGNEQDFYNLVPVITGPQGDYHSRGATPANDGPPLPGGMKHGDLNTPGTLMYEAWDAVDDAPVGRLRDLGVWSYLAMIYETAWHEEDQVDYSDTDCYGNWIHPDNSWDGVNTWALRLQNHVRGTGFYAAAAEWAEDVKNGTVGSATVATAADLDFDGENEYVIRNNRVWLAFEKYGARCVLAAAYDPAAREAQVLVGAPVTNPSAPGEEEFVGTAAFRCSAFKEMNGGSYADAVYAAVAVAGGWRFTSPDGAIVKTMSVPDGGYDVSAAYTETVSGSLYVRLGLSPNLGDLFLNGDTHLTGVYDGTFNTYTLVNSAGGAVHLRLGSASFNAAPADAGANRRNLALTEQVEVYGDGAFTLIMTLIPGRAEATGVGDAARLPGLAVSGPSPSPSPGSSILSFRLEQAAEVRVTVADVSGRVVWARELGRREPGEIAVRLTPRGADGRELPAGIYFVRVDAGRLSTTRKWVIVQ